MLMLFPVLFHCRKPAVRSRRAVVTVLLASVMTFFLPGAYGQGAGFADEGAMATESEVAEWSDAQRTAVRRGARACADDDSWLARMLKGLEAFGARGAVDVSSKTVDERYATLMEHLADTDEPFVRSLRKERSDHARYNYPLGRFVVLSRSLALLRENDGVRRAPSVEAAMAELAAQAQIGLGVDAAALAGGNVAAGSRRRVLFLLRAAGEAAYGGGVIDAMERRRLAIAMSTIAREAPDPQRYLDAVSAYAELPANVSQALETSTCVPESARSVLAELLLPPLVTTLAEALRADALIVRELGPRTVSLDDPLLVPEDPD